MSSVTNVLLSLIPGYSIIKGFNGTKLRFGDTVYFKIPSNEYKKRKIMISVSFLTGKLALPVRVFQTWINLRNEF